MRKMLSQLLSFVNTCRNTRTPQERVIAQQEKE